MVRDKGARRKNQPTIVTQLSRGVDEGSISKPVLQGIRVPRPPTASSPWAASVMRRNRASSTGPELTMRRALREAGARGYRTNLRGLPGRPDIAFPAVKLAVFVHGCYWHRCPIHGKSLPRVNREYWRLKFALNAQRDWAKVASLKALGWRVKVVWECEVKSNAEEIAALILRQHRLSH